MADTKKISWTARLLILAGVLLAFAMTGLIFTHIGTPITAITKVAGFGALVGACFVPFVVKGRTRQFGKTVGLILLTILGGSWLVSTFVALAIATK